MLWTVTSIFQGETYCGTTYIYIMTYRAAFAVDINALFPWGILLQIFSLLPLKVSLILPAFTVYKFYHWIKQLKLFS